MGLFPFNPFAGQTIQTNVKAISADEAYIAHIQIPGTSAVAANTTAVLAAVASATTSQTITSGFTNPAVPRNITATAGGNAANIKAIQVVVTGTNYIDQTITETLPVFTAGTAGTVAGVLAFKTITSVVIPAQGGTDVTISIGFGNVFGLPYLLPHNTIDATYLGNAKESTAPTVTTSSTNIESNTITLASALAGKVVDIYLKV